MFKDGAIHVVIKILGHELLTSLAGHAVFFYHKH